MKQLPILRYITPFPTLFFCSALYNAFVGRCHPEIQQEKIFSAKLSHRQKKAHRQDFLGKKENTAEDVAVVIDMGWGENASWILQAALLLFHINPKQEGMPKKEV